MMFALPQRALCEWLGTAFLLATVVGSGIMAQKLAGDGCTWRSYASAPDRRDPRRLGPGIPHRPRTMAGGSGRDFRPSTNYLRLCLAAARFRCLRRWPLHHGGLFVHGFDLLR
jgi:hypothetical protein